MLFDVPCSKVHVGGDASLGERSYFDAWPRAERALQTKSATDVRTRCCWPVLPSCRLLTHLLVGDHALNDMSCWTCEWNHNRNVLIDCGFQRATPGLTTLIEPIPSFHGRTS